MLDKFSCLCSAKEKVLLYFTSQPEYVSGFHLSLKAKVPLQIYVCALSDSQKKDTVSYCRKNLRERKPMRVNGLRTLPALTAGEKYTFHT